MFVLFLSFLLPVHPMLAGQRLDPYRLVLVVMFLPLFFGLLTGKAGRFTWSDALMLGFAGWIVGTLVWHHGMERFAFGGALAVEMFGGYAAGRLLIRSPRDFHRYVALALAMLLLLAPLAIYEFLTGRMVASEVLGRLMPVSPKFDEWRYGFSRVQGVFPHSILYGIYCSVNAANVAYVYRDRLTRMLPRMALVLGMTAISMSSGPILSVGLQGAAWSWGVITRQRWRLLMWLAAGMFVFLEIASNRGPIIILIETLTLDPSTGWFRYFIWVHALENIKAAPVAGIGLNDWVRPAWMVTMSVDSFWLVLALRHGVTVILLLGAALALHVWRIATAKDLSPEAQNLRNGYLIGLAGLCFTLTTVHVWDVLAVYVMFYIGLGGFFYTSDSVSAVAEVAPPQQTPRGPAPPVYARSFPPPNPDEAR